MTQSFICGQHEKHNVLGWTIRFYPQSIRLCCPSWSGCPILSQIYARIYQYFLKSTWWAEKLQPKEMLITEKKWQKKQKIMCLMGNVREGLDPRRTMALNKKADGDDSIHGCQQWNWEFYTDQCVSRYKRFQRTTAAVRDGRVNRYGTFSFQHPTNISWFPVRSNPQVMFQPRPWPIDNPLPSKCIKWEAHPEKNLAVLK